MCRSTPDGGRRCTGSSKARTRALGTARKAVERARHTLNQAAATGDAAAVAAAEAKLTAAQQRLNTTRAAHPHTPAPGHQRGHDTAEESPVDSTPTDDNDPATTEPRHETPDHHGDATPGAFTLGPGESYRAGNNVFHNRGDGANQVHFGVSETVSHYGDPVASTNFYDNQPASDAPASREDSDAAAQQRAWAQAQRNLASFAHERAQAQRNRQTAGNAYHYHGDGPVFVHGGTGDVYINGERVTSTSSTDQGRDNPQAHTHFGPDGTPFTPYAARDDA